MYVYLYISIPQMFLGLQIVNWNILYLNKKNLKNATLVNSS